MNRKVTAVILSFACLVSCTREANDVFDTSFGKVEKLMLELTQPSKTEVSYDADENIVKSRWKAEDEVLVTDLTSSARFQADESTHDTETGTFHGSLSLSVGADEIIAVYPYSAASVSDGQIGLTLPSTQNEGSESAYDIKAVRVPISGVSNVETTPAAMANLASIFRFKVSLPETLAGISLTGEKLLSVKVNADVPITGSGKLDCSASRPKVTGIKDKFIKYTFASEKDAVSSNEALLFLLPADFSAGASILWTVETTHYLIVWKLSPGIKLVPGYFYNAIFNLANPAWNFNSNGAEAERDFVITDKSKPYIDQTEASPTSISFHWVLPASFTAGRCKIRLYDSSSNLLKEHDYSGFNASNPFTPCAFTFSGLGPDTDYYVSVQGYSMRNPTEWSPLVRIHTATALAEQHTTLALQGFDLCPWGGDYINLAAGVKPSSVTHTSLSSGWSACPGTANVSLGSNNAPRWNEAAGSFSENYSAMLSELGLDGWYFSNVYMRPGYAQIGSGSEGEITSPALDALEGNTLHTVEVSFKAVPYTTSGSKAGSVTVSCYTYGGTPVGSQTIALAATPSIPDALPVWQTCSVSFDNVPELSRITITNGGSSNDICIDDIHITSNDALPHIAHDSNKNVYGLVADINGNPVSGVVVSDGYSIVKTNADGVYQFNSGKQNGYVFISQPTGYEATLDGVFPKFWHSTSSDTSLQERHDFTLTPVDNSNCIVLALGDFHLCNRESLYDLRQFRAQVGELKNTIASLQAQGKKVYGLTLGDMTWDIYWDNHTGHGTCNFDLTAYRTEVNNDFAGTTFPIWHTIGNHDHDYRESGDWDTVIPYKQILGPTYYSFNVGGYHIVSLDNVICSNNGTHNGRGDSAGLTSVIQDWLRADIAAIPASMPVIISMHEQAYKPTNPNGGYSAYGYASTLENLVSGHNVHIVTGHTHNINNVKRSNTIYEHNAGALCASWWWTGRYSISNEATWGGGSSADLSNTYHIGRDGAPGGYTIYTLSNGSMTWQYKGFGLPTSRQFKAYDRNQFALTAANWCPNATAERKNAFEALAAKQPDYSYAIEAGTNGVPSNLVYINVWNWDPDWTITVKEGSTNLTVTKLTDAYDPMHMVAYPATRLKTNDVTSTFVTCPTQHIFRVQASSATSSLTITVRDRFGNTYTETMTRPKPFEINWD